MRRRRRLFAAVVRSAGVATGRHLYLRWLGAAETLLHLHLEVVVELAAVQQGEARPCFQAVLSARVHRRVPLLLQGGRGGKHLVQVCRAWRNETV